MVQGLLQVLTFVIGIVVVRLLAKDQYALYAIGTTTAASLAFVAASGFTSSVLSTVGPRLDDRAFVTDVLAQVVRFRLRVLLVVGLLGLPVLGVLLRRAGGSWVETLAVVALIGLLLRAQAVLEPRQTLLQLHQRLGILQQISGEAAVIRLVALVPLFWLPDLGLYISVAGFVAAALWTARRAGVAAQAVGLPRHLGAGDSASARDVVVTNLRRLLPVNAFHVFQGQIALTLLAVFGNASGVADLGAVSRFAVAFALISQIGSAVLVPALARQPSDDHLGATYAKVVGASALMFLAALGVVLLLTDPLLALLGPKYEHLGIEFAMITIGSCIGSLTGIVSQLNEARGWTKWAWLYIPVSVAWMSTLVVVLDPSRVRDAALISAAGFVPALVVATARAVTGLRSVRRAQSLTTDA